MTYLGVTRKTANWLLNRVDVILALAKDMQSLAQRSERESVLVIGPLRVSGDRRGQVVCLWHVDYLSAASDESWGFTALTGPSSLLTDDTTGHDYSVDPKFLQRVLYVVNQRLQGLRIENVFHRSQKGGAHTCHGVKTKSGHNKNIGYFEEQQIHGEEMLPSILCIGPGHSLAQLVERTNSQSEKLGALIATARRVLAESVSRGSVRRTVDAQPDVLGLAQLLQPPKRSRTTSPALERVPDEYEAESAAELTYIEWAEEGSPLSSEQRQILEADWVLERPVRIVGAAGSGKTLLMMLMAAKRIDVGSAGDSDVRALYVTHNSSMRTTVRDRLAQLGIPYSKTGEDGPLRVDTLVGFAMNTLGVSDEVLESDAREAKDYRRACIASSMESLLREEPDADRFGKSRLLRAAAGDSAAFQGLVELIAVEVGVAIKGHGLQGDAERYIKSERRLSRLHASLSELEREFVFAAFRQYHQEVFEAGYLDPDDLAISLLGRLRTPLWELRRKTDGYDYIFVDETQLFNENERKVLPYLSRIPPTGHVPIILALDQAQQLDASVVSGLGHLGIESIEDRSLRSVHRSTRGILDLAFHLIQQTTDLFGPDFPDFTADTVTVIPDNNRKADAPTLVRSKGSAKHGDGVAEKVVSEIAQLQRSNLTQVAVICHAEKYWQPLQTALRGSKYSGRLVFLETRGHSLPPRAPVVVLSRPAEVGGQEFDAVICVGLEQGLVPPRIPHAPSLAATLEQRALREMYLAFTRARYRIVIVVSHGAAPSSLLSSALRAELLVERSD